MNDLGPVDRTDSADEFEPHAPREREAPLGPSWAGAFAAALVGAVAGHLVVGVAIEDVAVFLALMGTQIVVFAGVWCRSGLGALGVGATLWLALLFVASRSPLHAVVVYVVGAFAILAITALILRRLPVEPRSGG